MYLDYFSLTRHPFRITPDPSLFFPGGQDGRGVILNALIYGITSGEGILKVVGEVGSGKTMLCRMLEEELPETVEIVYIANPSLSAREILYAIAIELKLDVTSSTERLKALHLLQDYLLEKHTQGGTVVVFIEEAQSMPLETLEEIRLLSNLETHQHKLMQIVLFGQPELDKILAQKNIRQLRERITHSFKLEPLSYQATGDYIQYRLKVAGCPRPAMFSSRAVKMIASASTGLTRRINILADKAMLAAYADSPARQAPMEGTDPLVLPRHVKAAIRDTDYRKSYLNHWLFFGLGAAFLLFAVGVGINEIIYSPQNQVPGQIASEIPAAQTPVAAEGIVTRIDEEPEQLLEAAALIASTADGALNNREQVVQEAEEAEIVVEEVIEDVAEEVSAVTQASLPAASSNDEPTPAVAVPGQSVSIANQERSVPEPELEPELLIDPVQVEEAEADNFAAQAVVLARAAETQTRADITRSERVSQNDNGQGQASLVQTRAPQIEADPIEEITPVTEPLADENSVLVSPVAVVPSGLAELRMEPTAAWLRQIRNDNGYTIQLFSVPSTNPNGLEEYLQFLQLVSLLDETYICFMPISSEISGRWQIMYKDFQGVTPARNLINSLPVYIQQYDPYVRNLSGIQCSYPVATGN